MPDQFVVRHSFVIRASSFSVPLDESFADENKDAGGQRYNIEQENRWPELQAEP
jgi:hypothetical protein